MADPECPSASYPQRAPRRLGIIYNSQSGRHRRRWGRHPVPSNLPTIEANRPDEIGRAVADLAADDIDTLAVAGGDGTVSCVLTHVLLGAHFETPPVLALVPTGSTNMTARDVGFVNVRRRGWQPLLDWATAGGMSGRATQAERSVLRIQASDRQAPTCGMFFGIGAVHYAVQYTQNHLHGMGLRGDIGPSLAFARFLKSVILRDRRHFAPTQLRLSDDAGQRLDDATLLLVASTLDRLVLGFHPFWGKECAPIAWTAVSQNASRFLLRLPFVARGWPRGLGESRGGIEAAGYASHNSQELKLEFDGGFIVDGEFHRSRPDDGPVRLSVAGRVPFLSL